MTIIDEIKSRLDLVEIAGSYLTLQRAGKHWKAACPFHADKTPSLILFPDAQRWKCFGAGCGQSGDLLDLVQKLENLDFPATLTRLAEKAGVELKPPSPEQHAQAELIRTRESVFSAAAAFFQDRLWSRPPILLPSTPIKKALSGAAADPSDLNALGGAAAHSSNPNVLGRAAADSSNLNALAYAYSRLWTRETLQESGVGSFARDWEELRLHLRRAGVDLDSPPAVALVGFRGDVAGWAQAHSIQAPQAWLADSKIPAMPPHMLIYPHMLRGRVVYLAGRMLSGKGHWNLPHELAGPRQPYFNSRFFTPLLGPVLIVEGQGDALTLSQWNLPAVALAGVSSNDNLILSSLLPKHAAGSTLYLALDADEPGQAGAAKLAAALTAAGLKANQLRMLRWPAHDANDWLKAGASAQNALKLLESAATWLDSLASTAQASSNDSSLRAVFNALAPLNDYELALLRDDICQTLDLRRQDFDRLLRSSRRELSQAPAATGQASDSRYFILNNCIFSRAFNSQGGEVLDRLSNFTAAIDQDVLRDNGQDVEREFRIRGQESGRPLPTAKVKSREFAQMDWVLRDWGSRAIIEAGSRRKDELRSAIQHLSRQVERRTIYTHTGWRTMDSKRIYLSASGALGMDGMEVELDGDLALYSLPLQAQDPQAALRLSLQFLELAPLRVTVPLWSAVWLAPLREFIHPAFALWLYGATGTLKSSLSALVLNHYGAAFDDKHLPASFADTANRLEQKAFVVKDAPLVIDDFAPQKDQRSHLEYTRAAQRIVRDAGNLTGRGRLTSEITARTTYVPRSLILITGEDLPESESLVARLFVVELNRGDVDKDRLSALQSHKACLPHAMTGYLFWLMDSWNGLAETVPPRWHHYRRQAYVDGLHLRLPEAIAGLMLGWEMGLRYALSTEVISSAEYKHWMDSGWAALLESARSMTERVSEEKPDDLFIRTFRELLTQGKIYLRSREGGLPIGGSSDHGELIGWYDPEFIYLLPEAVYSKVARHFRDQGNNFPVRELTLRKMLKEAGLLIEKNGRLTCTEWLDGRSQRVLVLKRSILGE